MMIFVFVFVCADVLSSIHVLKVTRELRMLSQEL